VNLSLILIGPIPASIGALINLTDLRLQCNMFTGVLPLALAQCTKLRHLDISNNFLELDVVVVVPASEEGRDKAGTRVGDDGSGDGSSSNDLLPIDLSLAATTSPPKPGFTLSTTLLAIADGCPNIVLLNVSGNQFKPTTPQQASQAAVEHAVATAADKVNTSQQEGDGSAKSGWGGGLRAKDEADIREAGKKTPWVAPDIELKQSALFCQVYSQLLSAVAFL